MFVPPCMIAGGGLPYEILPANLIPGMDDVVRELPVFLAAADALNPLFLLQFPVREASRGPEHFVGARFKPINRMIELETTSGSRAGPHYDATAPARLRLRKRTLTSALVNPTTNYAACTLQRGALTIVPVHTTLQMRPSFAHIDAAEMASAEETDGKETKGKDGKPKKLQAVGIKQAQTKRDVAAQLSSYAHKRAQQESEPWIDLLVDDHQSDYASDERKRLGDVEDIVDDGPPPGDNAPDAADAGDSHEPEEAQEEQEGPL